MGANRSTPLPGDSQQAVFTMNREHHCPASDDAKLTFCMKLPVRTAGRGRYRGRRWRIFAPLWPYGWLKLAELPLVVFLVLVGLTNFVTMSLFVDIIVGV